MTQSSITTPIEARRDALVLMESIRYANTRCLNERVSMSVWSVADGIYTVVPTPKGQGITGPPGGRMMALITF